MYFKLMGRWIAAIIGAMAACVLPADATPTSAALIQLLDSYAANRGFNGTVLIARNGQVLARATYGKANLEWDLPTKETARYRIGSLTKPFTATLVMQLVQDNRLKLDGTLGEILPDLYAGTAIASVTIAQLLSHTSGIADVPGNYTDPWWSTYARHSYTPADFARAWIKPELVGKPGEAWRYNNSGFYLLGLVIERVSGRSFAQNLE